MRCLLALALASIAAGCAVHLDPRVPERAPRRSVEIHERVGVRCVRASLGMESPLRQPLAGPVESPELAGYLASVPEDLRRTVLAAGLEPLIATMERERAIHPGESSLALVSLQQRLDVHVSSLSEQVESMLFEVDCTGDEVERVLFGFERARSARELAFTVSSIVVGAVTGVVVGVVELHDRESRAVPITGIAGGVATGALGVAAFAHRPRPLIYRHERNVLAPIAAGDDSEHVYPTFIFRMLTLPMPAGVPTPREVTLARWDAILRESVAEEDRETARALLYGEGGVYDARLLEVRERFLGELESQLNALHRDLELLRRYLARVAESP